MLNTAQLNALWNLYYPNVFAYFYKRVNNYTDVEDLAAQTMTAFLGKIERDGLLDQPHGYLWRVAKSQLAEYLRKKYNHASTQELTENHDVTDESKVSEAYEHLISQVFTQAKSVLTPEELYLLTLTYQDGLNSVQIGTKLSKPPATIRKRLSRIIKKLKTNLTLSY
jgi:RNA polymerase sigma factor (sigma-70 family)